jgi:hypothetical protein
VEEARANYGSMFGDDPPDSESDALRELFPDCARPQHSWRERQALVPEPEGDDIDG